MKHGSPLMAATVLLALTACSTAEDAQACELMVEANEAYGDARDGGGLPAMMDADSVAHQNAAEALELNIEDEGLVATIEDLHEESGAMEGEGFDPSSPVVAMTLTIGLNKYCENEDFEE